VPFGILIFEAVSGAAPAIRGPVFIATLFLAFVTALAAMCDGRMVLAGGMSGAPRIARHLWRMCLGLTFATGSFFTNALPRILPGHMHVPPAYFLPMLVPLGLLFVWMIRVRLTGWFARSAAADST
jgi:hypothetical protein